jgi:nuclear pore complex protein Nup98-Nup96
MLRCLQTASSGFGAFGAAGGFAGGQSQQKGTAAHKWTKTTGVDGATTGATTQGQYMAITHMQQYSDHSFEELRVQDYEAGRKKLVAGGSFAGATTGFGAAASGFGGAPATSAFGAPAGARGLKKK